MSDTERPSELSFPPTVIPGVQTLCAQFATAWSSGQHPRIEDYLEISPCSDRFELLRELIVVELTHRHILGERPTPEEYRQRFPELAETMQTLFGQTSQGATH